MPADPQRVAPEQHTDGVVCRARPGGAAAEPARPGCSRWARAPVGPVASGPPAWTCLAAAGWYEGTKLWKTANSGKTDPWICLNLDRRSRVLQITSTLLILYNQDDNRVLHVALLGRARYCPLAMKRAAGWQGYGHAELSTQKNQAVVYVPGRTHHTVYLNYTYYINILEDAYGCRV